MKNLHNTTNTIEETLLEATSLCNKHGLTRLADITDFSLIKLPVWIGVRPNAKCLSQSAGKGMTSNAAKLSALMEGIEVSYAENVVFTDIERASINSKSIKNTDCVNIDRCAQNTQSQEIVEWVKVEDVSNNKYSYIPCLDFIFPNNENFK